MIRFPIPLLALTFAVAIVAATHVSTGPCDSEGAPALGIVEFTTGDASATFYVDDRFVLGNSIWIYQETNGVWTDQGPGVHTGEVTNHNLQRGSFSDCHGSCDPCTDVGDWDADIVIF